MKILVLGSGLLGVTAAYELGRRGHTVTVVDRKPTCGAETSFANGGQLSYSHAEPWANPSVLPKLPFWLLRDDSPLVFKPRADYAMMKWGLQFLRNCTSARATANGVNILRLGMYSQQKMTAIREQTGIAFDFAKTGILHIFSTEKDFDHAKRQHEFQAKFGDEYRILSRAECLALEPSLAHTSRTIAGGIHSYKDETGDAYLYCNALARVAAERHGVTFHQNVSIETLRTNQRHITGVVTSQGEMTADIYVMAMGSYSPVYLKQVGLHAPIYPMKGYSITLAANEFCPKVSLTDGSHKIVISRLGDRLRIAGTAEFAGYDDGINEKRIAPIIKAASGLVPKADWNQDIGRWACLRPSTPDGPPILGKTPIANLFLNTGHGTLGWTQAAGSAAIVSDIIEGKTPEIMMAGLELR